MNLVREREREMMTGPSKELWILNLTVGNSGTLIGSSAVIFSATQRKRWVARWAWLVGSRRSDTLSRGTSETLLLRRPCRNGRRRCRRTPLSLRGSSPSPVHGGPASSRLQVPRCPLLIPTLHPPSLLREYCRSRSSLPFLWTLRPSENRSAVGRSPDLLRWPFPTCHLTDKSIML